MTRPGLPIKNRLMVHVNKTKDGCWRWIGKINYNGYPLMRDTEKNRIAHRLSYEIFKGKIPKDLDIHHVCENRDCVNPDHLIAMDHETNIRLAKGNRLRKEERRIKENVIVSTFDWVKIENDLKTMYL